jgi:hypothetical protein
VIALLLHPLDHRLLLADQAMIGIACRGRPVSQAQATGRSP